MATIIECAWFILGLVFGSFLNVCISRVPREQSVVHPRSHCMHCGTPLRWYDNIPLLSWMILRGRCRACNNKVSWRYPAVELLLGILFAILPAVFGSTWVMLKFCIFSFLLVGLIFMDAETGLLPREFTYPGIAIGLVLSWFALTDSAGTQLFLRAFGARLENARQLSLLDAAVGALVGAAFFYFAWGLYYLARKRHGLGFGDIALAAMSGAFLGLKLVVFVLFLAPVLTIIYFGVVLLASSLWDGAGTEESVSVKQISLKLGPALSQEIPFGVFLGISSLTAMFIGGPVWGWYLSFFR